MNRLLYNPRLLQKYDLDLTELVILNYLNDKKDFATTEELLNTLEYVTGYRKFGTIALLQKKELITRTENTTLTKLGKAFFQEDTMLSQEEYDLVVPILNAWNNIKDVTTHNIAPVDQPQTKTVFKFAQIIASAVRGKLNPLIKGCKYQNKVLVEIEPLREELIIETIQDYALKFTDDYYPEDKKKLPKTILEFVMSHKSGYSEFFNLYFDPENNLIKKKTGASSKLAELGITPKTLRKVYDVMLTPSDRNSESAKYKMMKQLILLYEQWKGLTNTLDPCYTWSKSYRTNCKNFNFFTFDYVSWIGDNITGEKFPMYLQIKNDGHEIYAQFRAWYSDHYQIDLKVSRSKTEYLRGKTKKYLEGKK